MLEEQPQETLDTHLDLALESPRIETQAPTPTTAETLSPIPQTFDAVMTVKSPVILKNIYGANRNTGTRGQALSRFGGDKHTEDAVMRALRWLKTQQRHDGGWNGQSEGTGSTGLAILAYLAHGEIPGSSPEFGQTVQRAIEFLMRQPWMMTCSDGATYFAGEGKPHPRGHGAFTRKLTAFVRERGTVTLEQALRSMTGLSAQVCSLDGRGEGAGKLGER